MHMRLSEAVERVRKTSRGGPSRSSPAAVPATPSGRARHPPPQGRNEGGEAMGAVTACAVTAVLSSTVTLVAYACCVAAGNADRIEEGNE